MCCFVSGRRYRWRCGECAHYGRGGKQREEAFAIHVFLFKSRDYESLERKDLVMAALLQPAQKKMNAAIAKADRRQDEDARTNDAKGLQTKQC